jgi:hypothetical protein
MSQFLEKKSRVQRVAMLGASLLLWAGCDPTSAEPPPPAEPPMPVLEADASRNPERRGIGAIALPPPGPSAMAVTVDPRSSLFITEDAIVRNFPLQRVMNQLVAQSAVPGLTSLQLFQSWWATQNVPNCAGTLNGYPYTCPRNEGTQAGVNPFINPGVNPDEYIPTALVNRFDLAPTSGSDCGEYRIVYAKRSGISNPGNRNLLIFEAVLPNPNPGLGLAGCTPVAKFWADLSDPTLTVATRVSRLQNFYFTGLAGGFMPVVHIDNYGNRTGAVATGQVRTNQFMQPIWTLRQFSVRLGLCGSASCLRFVPVTVNTNPSGQLFNPTSGHPQAPAFRGADFPAEAPSLAINDINLFNMNTQPQYLTGQSNSQGPENDYLFHFGPGPSAFHAGIQAQIPLGSPLTPRDIVARALALSCAGCHQLSNGVPMGGGIVWPPSAGFVHVQEQTEPGVFGPRFRISPALIGTFLPHRKAVIETFLNTSCGDAICQPWETHASCSLDCP